MAARTKNWLSMSSAVDCPGARHGAPKSVSTMTFSTAVPTENAICVTRRRKRVRRRLGDADPNSVTFGDPPTCVGQFGRRRMADCVGSNRPCVGWVCEHARNARSNLTARRARRSRHPASNATSCHHVATFGPRCGGRGWLAYEATNDKTPRRWASWAFWAAVRACARLLLARGGEQAALGFLEP